MSSSSDNQGGSALPPHYGWVSDSTTRRRGEDDPAIKLVLYRLDRLDEDQKAGFAEVKADTQAGFAKIEARMKHLEHGQRDTDIWRGKTDQRLEHHDNRLETVEEASTSGYSKVAMSAIGLTATALGIIGTLVATGGPS